MGFDTSAYTEEAFELLSELEDSLLALEESPDDRDLIGRVFRAMHTIKGSGAMFGFDDVAAFTHEVETVFDMVRNGDMRVTKPLIDLTLAARDYIRALLQVSLGGDTPDSQEGERIIAGLKSLSMGGAPADTPVEEEDFAIPTPTMAAATSPDSPHANTSSSRTYRVRFQPNADIFANGTNPLLLLNELKELGTCRIVAFTQTIPDLEEIDAERCFTSWEIFLTTDQGENAIRDVFIFVEDACRLDVRVIDDADALESDEGSKRLGEILVDRGSIPPQALERVLAEQQPLGQRLVKAGLVKSDDVQAALVEQKVLQENRDKRKGADSATSVRVPSDRLDKLVDLVGELVTVQARLSQTSGTIGDHNLQVIAEEVERLTNELRDNTMSIRMLPIGTTFNKFKRLVRDLSVELGKEVEMTTDGGDTELDKTVIDQLNDPLVHIIRNSIDHGVETPDLRAAAGKSRIGTVRLSAEHSGTNVLIRVKDDGKGLDATAIRQKGIEKGLISPDADLSEEELFQLIFAPGFSTAKAITNVSGRGVGMDVVKRSIDGLRGQIGVQSKRGQGTTITLSLPLTLAIIEGLLVQIANEFFVLPLAAVEECVELTQQVVSETHGRHVINVRGEIVPYISLRERFFIQNPPLPEVQQIVISRVEEQRIGFVVDHVIGQHQTVIKTLGKNFRHSEEFSGATILGDGTVALILDLNKMTRYVEDEEAQAVANQKIGH
ncbi:MAG: chemotaxis protein CheA [Magnetococcales bacterium]|nr:chemotaxis protein CheA [Magnetococcales bacterium]NGZ28282.1 chemotaxis protein CheA [Magnetococcales bacterium]